MTSSTFLVVLRRLGNDLIIWFRCDIRGEIWDLRGTGSWGLELPTPVLNIHISYTGFVKVQGHWLKVHPALVLEVFKCETDCVSMIESLFLHFPVQTFRAAVKPNRRTHTHVPETLITITAVRPWRIICLMTPPTRRTIYHHHLPHLIHC